MIIRKIEILNFRGFRNKIIDFGDKSVVLLSAANGIGKTTVIDAIEWCLTGDIGRLKNAFDSRSTNDNDRRMNKEGILKNRETGNRQKVKVVLWLINGEKETVIKREQTKDDLDPTASTVTVNGNEEDAKAFIREYVGESFYNYHFCDVQKSFNVQSKKRKDLEDFFGEFITDYTKQRQIALNLDIFADDVERYIADKEDMKVKLEVIQSYEEQMEKVREKTKKIPYPGVVFYSDEKCEIAELNEEELITQKEKLKNCGYLMAEENLSNLVRNEALKRKRSIIKEIRRLWETKEESIRQVLLNGLSKDRGKINSLEAELSKLKSLSLSRDTIFTDAGIILTFKNDGFTKLDFETDKKAIHDNQELVKSLTEEIKLLAGNNKMLKLLTSFSANKQVVINYRDASLKEEGSVRCPICGSESFATMDENLILKEADDYINQNGELVKQKEVRRSKLTAEIDQIYQRIICRAETVVKEEKERLETDIRRLNILKEETKPYFDKIRELDAISSNVIDAEVLSPEELVAMMDTIESSLLKESKESEIRKSYQQILTVIGYRFENETVQQTYEKVRNLTNKSDKVINFSYVFFVSKLNAIDSILANQTLMDLGRKVKECNNKNKEIDGEIKKLKKLKEAASQRAKDIREIVDSLSKDEYEKVGPTICRFYNKLARFDYKNGIHIVHKNEGISLIDDKGKNIVNVLSNGQISVFMLAHFFAGINARNTREKMKVYFIDDLTACMDDVNMLSFMDLLKYQMSSKETMEQLFFVTCDDRISNLLKYKMNGRGIELCEIKEADLA